MKTNSIDRNTKTAFSNESKSEVSPLKPLISQNPTMLEELPTEEMNNKGKVLGKLL